MERAGHAKDAAVEKTKETTSAASKEQNKAVMHDSNASAGDRISAAGGAAKDAVAETYHGAKADHHKNEATK